MGIFLTKPEPLPPMVLVPPLFDYPPIAARTRFAASPAAPLYPCEADYLAALAALSIVSEAGRPLVHLALHTPCQLIQTLCCRLDG